MSRKKTEIAKLTEAIMKNQNIEDVVDLQSVLKQMLKEGVETLLKGQTGTVLFCPFCPFLYIWRY